MYLLRSRAGFKEPFIEKKLAEAALLLFCCPCSS
jgi:hypothetical protein